MLFQAQVSLLELSAKSSVYPLLCYGHVEYLMSHPNQFSTSFHSTIPNSLYQLEVQVTARDYGLDALPFVSQGLPCEDHHHFSSLFPLTH